MNPDKKVPADLHEERGKWVPCAILALLAILLPAVPYLLSIAEARPSAPPSIHKVSLLRETLAQPAPPRPKPEPEPKPEPPKKPKPAKPTVAEIALKEIQASLIAEKKKREEEKRKKREREEAEKKRKATEKKKREEAKKKKQAEEEKRKKEEAKKRAEELAEAARTRAQEAAAARAKEAADRAAELRAQADAASRAAEAARLADLRGLYLNRIRAQIESRLDTPAAVLGRDDLVAEIRVLLHSDGELKGWPQVTRSSGFPEYDEAAIRAIIQAAPLVVPSDEPELLGEFLQLDLRIRPQ